MLHVTIDVLYNFEAMSASKEGNRYILRVLKDISDVGVYFNFPIFSHVFSNIWFERFSSPEWKTTEKISILKDKDNIFDIYTLLPSKLVSGAGR